MVLGVAVLIVLGMGTLTVYGSLSSRVEVSGNGIVIRGMYGTTVLSEEITGISLEDEMPKVLLKNNGLGSGEIRKGHFTLAELGLGRLYTESDTGPFIYIFTDESYIIISYKEPAQTEA